MLCGVAAQQSAASTAQPSYDARSEYFTKEEMAELFKPKKKKVRFDPTCVQKVFCCTQHVTSLILLALFSLPISAPPGLFTDVQWLLDLED